MMIVEPPRLALFLDGPAHMIEHSVIFKAESLGVDGMGVL